MNCFCYCFDGENLLCSRTPIGFAQNDCTQRESGVNRNRDGQKKFKFKCLTKKLNDIDMKKYNKKNNIEI